MSLGMALVIVAVLLASDQPAFATLLPGAAIGGLGMGLGVGPLTETALVRVAREHASEASGLFNSVGQLSASFGFANVGSTYFAITATATGPSDPACDQALTIALSVGIAVALLAYRLPRHHITGNEGTKEPDANR